MALKMTFDYKRAYMFYALQPQFLFLIDATVKQMNVFNEVSHRFLGSVNFHFKNHVEYTLHQQLHVIFSFVELGTFVLLPISIVVAFGRIPSLRTGYCEKSPGACLDPISPNISIVGFFIPSISDS